MKALSIHAHFYQPPREDPLTGELPVEKGAAPYHDFNERILAECYRPNAILGNFEYISFNVGATLMNWLQNNDQVTYRRISAQDKAAFLRSGVGNAIAQPYFHVILPLANRREKETQIHWGIMDFVKHFGRIPKGMWLPETAVDYETLSLVAQHGIQYTILAPWQARENGLDPTKPYLVKLDNGDEITVFFYHDSLSGGVSFHPNMTENAYEFVEKQLESKYFGAQDQLMLIASDGELYGHHKKFRDWFLAYLVQSACQQKGIEITTPGLWLKSHPPKETIGIRENTSWSCHHGIARWSKDCGCTPGNGEWKRVLRQAFDRLASTLDDIFSSEGTLLGIDPWEMRNRYISVLSKELSFTDFLSEFSLNAYPSWKVHQLELLMRSQFERLRMFTSCGWFFDRFDRIETRNNIAYAAHALWLVYLATGINLSDQFEEDLLDVRRSDISISGQEIYQDSIEKISRYYAQEKIINR
ncbi:MAG: DUF3536 domain-containing protein [Anaerolineales bacterium]|nr:DUF3536 domain-containing protein [Anaerolineales bacterium]